MIQEKQEEKAEETKQNERMEIDISVNEKLSSAEIFYLNCFLRNPKDVWNEFTAIYTNSFDLTKLDSLLCQKSKDFFIWEKRKNCEPKCFGLILTEDISIRNWIDKKPEDVGIVFPKHSI